MKTRRKILSAMVAAFGGAACTGVAIAAPTRPATISPAMTGPNSRVTDSTTTVATAPSALNRLNPV